MRLLAVVLALLLPGCRGQGAEGVTQPGWIDFAHLVRPASPNTALAAPAGFVPAPDIVTRRYDLPPAALFAAVQRAALAQPRTYLQAVLAEEMQAHFVARSAWLNFPDLIAVQVTPDSGLILWSRSLYGHSDFGVNRKRLQAWLAALDAALDAALAP